MRNQGYQQEGWNGAGRLRAKKMDERGGSWRAQRD